MENTNEQKAQAFMEYIASNLPKLKRNLKKNITFDPDLLDDVISESILKIYNSICKNGTNVTDYERYFFIVSKFTYILSDNNKKKLSEKEDRELLYNTRFDVYDETFDEEERLNNTISALDKIKIMLTEKFGEEKSNIYLTYMDRKANGRTNYKLMADEYNLTVREISSTINEIKAYLENNSELTKIKKQYTI